MTTEEIKKALKVIAPFEGMRIEKHIKQSRAKKAGVSDEQKKFLIANGYIDKYLNLKDKGTSLL